MFSSRTVPFTALLLLLFACAADAQTTARWVFFTDKGSDAALAPGGAEASALGITAPALERRALMRGYSPGAASLLAQRQYAADVALIDAADLPVREDYLRAVLGTGATLRVVSRWLNAASVLCTREQAGIIAALPCVARVEPVRRWKRDAAEQPFTKWAGVERVKGASQYGLDYGASLPQLEVINVPKVHDVWIDGTDILIGMVDDGYRWRTHIAFQKTRVLGEYDFIQKDSVTENQDGDSWSQDSHGTVTFSSLAANLPGTLIGPAFNAAFFLAKTEVHDSEMPVEEDNWVAGVEWLESQGVAVVSSSLGYATFDDSSGYRYENGDFDGQTAVTTRAASRAARLGVVISTAMGNEGNVPGTLIAPSDADSILSIGAISVQNAVASFSSNGPTNDGRTKPDVVAPGVRVVCAVKNGDSTFSTASGTSLSTPLASGVAALVRSARPELTPIQVREALRSTADNSSAPDNSRGWGKIDAWRALLHHGMVISTNPKIFWDGKVNRIAAYVLSPDAIQASTVRISYQIDNGPDAQLAMALHQSTDGLGAGSGLYIADLPALPADATVRFFITASDAKESRTSPYGAPAKRHIFRAGETRNEGAEYIFAKSFVLEPAFPDPAPAGRGAVTIVYGVPAPGASVSLEVFDMLGHRVATLAEGWRHPGRHTAVLADPTLASGAFFIALRSGDTLIARRLMLVR